MIYYQNRNWVDADEFDALVDRYNRLYENFRENRLLSFLYLHLYSQKDLIEEKAYSLVNKYGLLGALNHIKGARKCHLNS